MDLKSPLTKRQKISRTTFNDVRDELNRVIQLRKNAGEIIDDMYSAETSEWIKFLSKIEVELSNTKTYTIPDVDIVLQNFKGLLQQNNKAIKKNTDQVTLFAILKQKSKCPISKIIDEV